MTAARRTPSPSGARFTGSTVIVTGGGRGIGRAISERLAGEGAEILLVGRTIEPMERTVSSLGAAGGRAWFVRADLERPEDIAAVRDAAMARWGRVDVLVNNAAVDDRAEVVDIRVENWDHVLRVNLTAPFLLSQAVARDMVASGLGGAIVNVASVDADAYDGPYTSYAVAKAGLLALTRCMAVELAQHGIRVNAVSPGWTLTEMMGTAMGTELANRLATRFDRFPIGRAIRPEEVAAAVAYLASADATGSTGTNLVVDGGVSSNLYVLETLPKEGEIDG
jgi:NAD(P)-dependent dehydrogenase (short-subunit alcohol dehydrogenase family)